jgi:uncharacterized membrane protein
MIVLPTFVALLLALLGAGLVAFLGQGTLTGALAGLFVAFLAILGLGSGALPPLAVFVLGAGALTRLGRSAKEAAGLAEQNRGRRGAVHVAAKLGLPALLGLAGLLDRSHPSHGELLRLAYTSALAGAFADTAATEVGPLVRGPAFALRGAALERVPHGTPGAMSTAGLVAAALGALATTAAASITSLIPPAALPLSAGAGFGAAILESLIAPTALGRALGHHGRNAAISVLAAGAACGTWVLNGRRM